MRDWKTKKLSEVCARITDGTHQTPKYFSDGIMFLSSKNVTSGKIDWGNIKYIDEKQHLEMHKRLAPQLNDILLAKNGTTGVAAKVDKDVVFDIYVSLALLRPLEGLLPDFLLHFINSPLAKRQFNKRLKGIGVPNLHLEEIREVEIPLPSLPEQQRIVAILDEAFSAIAKAKANAQQNLKNAKELFESYLQGVFEQRGEDWEEKTLGELSERVSVGHVGPTSEFYCDPNIGVPFIRSQNVRSGYLDWKGIQYIKKEFHLKLKKSQLKIGDILFVRVGANRGDCCILKENIKELNCANIVFARLKEGNVDFIDLFCQSPIGKQQLLGMSVGAAQGVINTKSVAELIIPYPPIKEQQNIVERTETLSTETQKLEAIYQQKINDLEELKKVILQKAFSGELKTAEMLAV